MFTIRNYFLTVLTLGFVSLSSAQTNKEMVANFNEDQKKVYSTISKMVSAFQNKNIDGILSTYEENAVVMFEPQKPIQGKENLRKAFSQFVMFNPTYKFGGHEIYISGNIAKHISPWSMVGNLPDGTEIKESGLSIAILRKQADGNWLMIQDNPHGQYLLDKFKK
ncbi:YybH family protein [Tenacibaculum xiamenense]|uniref:YybH family protein n=1 Tax=Tenacibaculum xiamenense TaxID=1261553 RepID=UPI003893A50B